MYGLACVLVPGKFASLQSELDRTLAPFRRAGDEAFPRTELGFDDATDTLKRLHRSKFRYNSDGSLSWLDSDAALSFDLRLSRLSEHMGRRDLEQQLGQKAFGRPACRRMALAVWRLGIPIGTGKFRPVIGPCQISWLPLPWRTSVHPAARSSSRRARSNCGAI